jgi:hypothetical protein
VRSEGKRYLAIVQLAGGADRPRSDIALVAEWLRRFAKSEHELAFRSSDGLLFGFFLRTASQRFMRAEFEKSPGTRNGDALMLVEIGELVDALGFNQGATWLQRH